MFSLSLSLFPSFSLSIPSVTWSGSGSAPYSPASPHQNGRSQQQVFHRHHHAPNTHFCTTPCDQNRVPTAPCGSSYFSLFFTVCVPCRVAASQQRPLPPAGVQPPRYRPPDPTRLDPTHWALTLRSLCQVQTFGAPSATLSWTCRWARCSRCSPAVLW